MPKTKTSLVWRFFSKNAGDDKYTICSLCGRKISHNGGTSNMNNHLRNVHKRELAETSSGDGEETGDSRQENQDERAVVKFLSKDMQPFSIVEDSGFQDFVKYLSPTFRLPSRKHISTKLIPELHAEVCAKLRPLIDAARFVAVTSDLWTSKNQTPYISLTAHFIAERKLRSAVLASEPIPGSHTAARIATQISAILDNWGCQQKVSSITTDNGANIVAAVSQLNIRHVPCVAHTINLVVNDAMTQCPDISAVVDKCKTIVRFFKSSTVASETLDGLVTSTTGKSLRLIQSVPTRWNSVYDMLQRIVDMCDALVMAQLRLPQSPAALTGAEIMVSTDMVRVLKPYKEATETLSGEHYPTAALILPTVQGIFAVLNSLEGSLLTDDGRLFAAALRSATASRLAPYEGMKPVRGCTFLDPRFKRFGFRVHDNAKLAARQIEAELSLRLGAEEAGVVVRSADDVSVQPSSSSGVGGPRTLPSNFGSSLFDCVRAKVSANKTTATSTSSAAIAVRQYSEKEVVDWGTDVIGYWTSRPKEEQELANLAERYIVIPATSVPSERVFSAAGQIISDSRTRLKPEKAAMLIFLKQNQWLY